MCWHVGFCGTASSGHCVPAAARRGSARRLAGRDPPAALAAAHAVERGQPELRVRSSRSALCGIPRSACVGLIPHLLMEVYLGHAGQHLTRLSGSTRPHSFVHEGGDVRRRADHRGRGARRLENRAQDDRAHAQLVHQTMNSLKPMNPSPSVSAFSKSSRHSS